MTVVYGLWYISTFLTFPPKEFKSLPQLTDIISLSFPFSKVIYWERVGIYKSFSVSTNNANSFSHPNLAFVAYDVAETSAASLNLL